MVPPGKRQRTAQPLTGGSPLREDDGGEGDPPASTFSAVIQRERQRQPPSRTRTRRSGSRPKRRSKGAREAFAARRKRSRADFATTQSPTQGQSSMSSVDAGDSRLPPSSSRSGDPPRSGNAVRCRYLGRTNRGIPARSARMTAEFSIVAATLSNQQGDSRAERENDSRV